MFLKPSTFVEILNLEDACVIKDYFSGKVFVVDQYPKINILKDIISGIEIEELLIKYKDDFELFVDELLNLGLIELSEEKMFYYENVSFGGIITKFYSDNHKKDIREIIIDIGGVCKKIAFFVIEKLKSNV